MQIILGAEVVPYRRPYHVSRVNVWASEVPPGPHPLCETWTVGIWLPQLTPGPY